MQSFPNLAEGVEKGSFINTHAGHFTWWRHSKFGPHIPKSLCPPLQPTASSNTRKTLQSSNASSKVSPQAGCITRSLAADTHTHDARREFTRAGAHCDVLDSICGDTSLFEDVRRVEVNLREKWRKCGDVKPPWRLMKRASSVHRWSGSAFGAQISHANTLFSAWRCVKAESDRPAASGPGPTVWDNQSPSYI